MKFSSVTHQAALVWHRRLKVLMLSQNVIGNGVEFLLGKSSTRIQMKIKTLSNTKIWEGTLDHNMASGAEAAEQDFWRRC